MEKLRPILATLKKHHFWVLCGLIVVVAPLSCMKAGSDLKHRYDNRTRQLDGHFTAVKNAIEVRDESGKAAPHPNEGVSKAIRRQSRASPGESVQSMGAALQRAEAETFAAAGELVGGEKSQKAKDFAKEFEGKWVKLDVLAEKVAKLPKGERLPSSEEIEENLREWYQTRSRATSSNSSGRSISIPKKRDSKDGPTAGFAVDLPGGKPAQTTRPRKAKRRGWSSGPAQANWRSASRSDGPTGRPLTLEIRVAQEDVWVYESLLRIVQNLNEGVTPVDREKAVVWEIRGMDIGKDASARWKAAAEPILKGCRPGRRRPGCGDHNRHGRLDPGQTAREIWRHY